MGVYNKVSGGWTEKAKSLSNDINEIIKETLEKYYDENMSIEEICYVANSTIQEILLYKQRKERKMKNLNSETRFLFTRNYVTATRNYEVGTICNILNNVVVLGRQGDFLFDVDSGLAKKLGIIIEE